MLCDATSFLSLCLRWWLLRTAEAGKSLVKSNEEVSGVMRGIT